MLQAHAGHATIADLVGPELRRSVAAPVTLLATRLADRAGDAAVAVLFYGSALREATLDGVLDFYVVLDRAAAWPGGRLAAAANRLLPPNVGYLEEVVDGRIVRAKYALVTLAQLRHGVQADALDTTLWTRLSQPCACVHARSDADWAHVCDAVARASITAAQWAAALGPRQGDALAYWRALYACTYQVELRLESTARHDVLLAHDPDRYVRLLPEAWRAGGIAFDTEAGGTLRPHLARAERAAALRRWQRRKRLGRPLNVLRLLKAAFTFDGAMDYVAWKVERHTGTRLELRPWQRRFPLLAAPGLYYRLRQRGLLR